MDSTSQIESGSGDSPYISRVGDVVEHDFGCGKIIAIVVRRREFQSIGMRRDDLAEVMYRNYLGEVIWSEDELFHIGDIIYISPEWCVVQVENGDP